MLTQLVKDSFTAAALQPHDCSSAVRVCRVTGFARGDVLHQSLDDLLPVRVRPVLVHLPVPEVRFGLSLPAFQSSMSGEVISKRMSLTGSRK
jgi:hypothetical protein